LSIQLIPYYKELLADLDTPVSIYLKLNQPNSFLLESVTGGEQVARYSFIGFDPFCIIRHDGEKAHITQQNTTKSIISDPIEIIQSTLNQYHLQDIPDLPTLFGGAIGYFSWETIAYIEKMKQLQKPKTGFPLAHFLFPRSLVIFDHAKRKLIVASFAETHEEAQAQSRIAEIEQLITKPTPVQPFVSPSQIQDPYAYVKSNYPKEAFIEAIKKVKHHIFEGDVFQLVLSQKFSINSDKNPFDIYRRLRYINPSPYMYYFNFTDYQIIGSSPEILVRLNGRKAQVRPIAGTRPRPKHESEEAQIIQELLNDQKERAEHIMLVDLGRNDLGRVCDFNSIQTSGLMQIEKYSHVLHMVSYVEGDLKQGKNAFDLLKATFPAGTVSGAPKIKAIELINELEPTERGPYSGALGYFDFRGNMDMCIVIRTILSQAGSFSIQAGAGIVADSDPESEYKETQNKARGMIEACLS